MVNPILGSTLAAARRAMRRHQRVPPRESVPMPRLLAGEAVYVVRMLGRPERGLPALAAASLVVLALSSATPGPVAPLPLLVPLGVVAAALGALLGARIFPVRRPPSRDAESWWRGAISGVGMVVVMALVVLAVGWLLALVVSVLL